jgi:hypothetical protein
MGSLTMAAVTSRLQFACSIAVRFRSSQFGAVHQLMWPERPSAIPLSWRIVDENEAVEFIFAVVPRTGGLFVQLLANR